MVEKEQLCILNKRVTRFWILDFGVSAVTEPVEVQSNDFGFWIGSALKERSLKFGKIF
jgi:hypothetical protein